MVLTATEIIRDLAKRIPSIKLTVVYNASTDPNHLLGRPGQYTSKAAFTDSRLTASQIQGDTDLGDVQAGGGVEVYPTAAGARQRAHYLYTLTTADPSLGVEYDFLAGPILLRVSGLLTPAQAAVDKRALAAITGMQVKTES